MDSMDEIIIVMAMRAYKNCATTTIFYNHIDPIVYPSIELTLNAKDIRDYFILIIEHKMCAFFFIQYN